MEASEETPAQREERRRLMQEAGQLRSRVFPIASDEAWRRERLYRYLYWRENGQHAPSNLVGAWDLPDVQRELSRWQEFARQNLSEEAVLDILTAELARTYGKGWEDALEEGTSPLLATVGQPIWHADTGSLLPQALGHLKLVGAERYDDARLGWSYNYANDETHQRVTLILYTVGLDDIADGIGDPRLEQHFRAACMDIAQVVEANGGTLIDESIIAPFREELSDPHGRTVEFVSSYIEADLPGQGRRGEGISLRGFREHWLKIRYTRTNLSDDATHPGLDEINSDIADFVAHFA